ncbi:MAG: spore maturation protein [Bacteriovoracaceae bacterium]|nr:spore maturation protein [Bacteriovoracaceae bacterium]
MNAIWIAMIFGAIICGALTGNLDAVSKASVDSAKSAVELSLGLIGVMAFWLGMMQILQKGGLLKVIARVLRPIMSRIFPEVPPEHPAMSMMILNMTSNMLGLANAATPFGLKAMMELDKLNKNKGEATNAMALFLAINTSSVSLLPTTVIALRASMGSTAPASIFFTTLVATTLSTLSAILISTFLSKLKFFKPGAPSIDQSKGLEISAEVDTTSAEKIIDDTTDGKASGLLKLTITLLAVGLACSLGYALFLKAGTADESGQIIGMIGSLKSAINDWPLLILIAVILLFGVGKRVDVYDAVATGGKEGFQVAVKIIPFLVAILVAVGMLRASGAIDLFVNYVSPVMNYFGVPSEVLPMALIRTLSGSGGYAVAADIMKQYGVDSLIGQIVSTMQGSTETTFYVIAVYFGSIQIRKSRHTLAACLFADTVGIISSIWICKLVF